MFDFSGFHDVGTLSSVFKRLPILNLSRLLHRSNFLQDHEKKPLGIERYSSQIQKLCIGFADIYM